MSTLTLTVGGQTCPMNHVLTVPSFSGSGETPVQLSQVLLVTLPSQVCPQAGRISARAPTLGGVLVQLSQFGQHCHRVMERLLSPPGQEPCVFFPHGQLFTTLHFKLLLCA